jgi:hypothetical protein
MYLAEEPGKGFALRREGLARIAVRDCYEISP